MTPATLKSRRTSIGLSQSDLAEAVGLTAAQIDLAERQELGAEVTFLLNLAMSLLEEQSASFELTSVAV